MTLLHSFLVNSHIAVGSVALVLFRVPALAQKGSRRRARAIGARSSFRKASAKRPLPYYELDIAGCKDSVVSPRDQPYEVLPHIARCRPDERTENTVVSMPGRYWVAAL